MYNTDIQIKIQRIDGGITMKKWNAPEIAELNITETANGYYDTDVEFWPFVNDNKKSSTTDPFPNKTPDTVVDSVS